MELELLREIPGYKAILKSVLKAQIQLLVEQLCDQAGEESIILTASLSDGTLSHLGSSMGKGFFVGRDEIKSQFLGYCLKNFQNREDAHPRTAYQQERPPDIYGQGPPGPKKQRFQASPGSSFNMLSPGFGDQGVQDFGGSMSHSVSSPSPMRRKPLQKRPPHLLNKSSESLTAPVSNKSDIESVATCETSTAAIVKSENTSDTQDSYGTVTDSGGESANVAVNVEGPFGLNNVSQSSETREADVTQDANISGAEQSGDSNLDSSIKIEPATQDEELEITGIEMAGGATGIPGDWGPDASGELGYQSGLSGDDFLNQSGNQFSIFDVQTLQRGTKKGKDNTDLPRMHICYECGKTFRRSHGLKKHISKIHGGERVLCSLCGQSFSDSWGLKRHITLHTGQKDFVCSECNKPFSRKDKLQEHFQCMHTKEQE